MATTNYRLVTCCLLGHALSACAGRPAPSLATATSTAACEEAPVVAGFTTRGDSIEFLDDSAQIMIAVGNQLRRDHRCGRLLFSAILMCGSAHPQPCDAGNRYDPNDPKRPPQVKEMPRVVDAAMRAAGGHPCLPLSCVHDRALIEFALSPPLIYADSALVRVITYQSAKPALTYFEQYAYGVRRVSKFRWQAVTRRLESTGHYGTP